MTGVADLYLYLKRPYSKDRRKRLLANFLAPDPQTRFVVLSWKRTGSNLLCGILHHHPEIVMHNELFNPIDVFTYHPAALKDDLGTPRWTVLTRDLFPEDFLDFIWTGRAIQGDLIKPHFRAVGFKSFPDHWLEVRNEHVWQGAVLEDLRVKKVILHREDELAVYVSIMRADQTGHYMTHSYPKELKIHVDPASFQTFVDNYRDTFRRKYRSPIEKRDTFWVTYEQLCDIESFESDILPRLWDFLGVKNTVPLRMLRETQKQADPDEDLSRVIANYDELEFCFRHSNVSHFAERRKKGQTFDAGSRPIGDGTNRQPSPLLSSWSLLLPVCSRGKTAQAASRHAVNASSADKFDTNRFIDLVESSQYNAEDTVDETVCWRMLEDFAFSLRNTSSEEQLKKTECIVGIDLDDPVFQNAEALKRIECMLKPCSVVHVVVQPHMYGKLCHIWNLLGQKARNDFMVLLGDDIRLLDPGWQERIVKRFHGIATKTGLPLGAACVAMTDLAFPGFPTFPVVHRWHHKQFGSILPKQFVNQDGDPYLYELYSRFNAASFEVTCRLNNTIGGDGEARYRKHRINWRGQILSLNLRRLKSCLGEIKPNGVCIDVVVPSYRVNNDEFLRRIVLLRASVDAYVKFWIVVDNPSEEHVHAVQTMAKELNNKQLEVEGNYFINVIHYGANRGASYARNTGFNYSTAEWVLFLDDDVIPDENILDAYIGGIRRYPDARVLVGMTELPEQCNLWTEMLRTCNVGYFYGISKRMNHPPWGVTANLMVRGARYNSTIQFKGIYPKTGGGEDIDLVYQFKGWYRSTGVRATAAVPEAKVQHPWWNKANTCYKQIIGWAWGDSLCITEWPSKTFLTCPNWVEHITFLAVPFALYSKRPIGGLVACASIFLVEHIWKGLNYYRDACQMSSGLFRRLFVALGAGSVISAQEVTRTIALVRRCSLFSLCRRVDWFDGQQPRIKLDIQLGSIIRFSVNTGLTWLSFHCFGY